MLFHALLCIFVFNAILVQGAIDGQIESQPKQPEAKLYEQKLMTNNNAEQKKTNSLLSSLFNKLMMKSLYQNEKLRKTEGIERAFESEFRKKQSILKILNKQNDKDFFRF